MKVDEKLEIKNNEFLRQFEADIDGGLIKLEYSEQPRQVFLTKFIINENLKEKGYDEQFLKAIFDKFSENGTRVMPTCPNVVKFFKAHRNKYRSLLPTGINI